jgi:hypothetical protein
MKKVILTLFFLVSFVFANNIGKIVAFKGEATITRDGKDILVNKNTLLMKNDTINTTSNTKLQILFKDETIISVGQNSTLKINDYLFEDNNVKAEFAMAKGVFRTITGKIGKIAPQNFKLKTKTASIGIRGTQIVTSIADNTEKIFCTEGQIEIKNNFTNDRVIVNKGEFISLKENSIEKFNVKKTKQSDIKEINKNITLKENLAVDTITIKKEPEETTEKKTIKTSPSTEAVVQKDTSAESKTTSTQETKTETVENKVTTVTETTQTSTSNQTASTETSETQSTSTQNTVSTTTQEASVSNETSPTASADNTTETSVSSENNTVAQSETATPAVSVETEVVQETVNTEDSSNTNVSNTEVITTNVVEGTTPVVEDTTASVVEEVTPVVENTTASVVEEVTPVVEDTTASVVEEVAPVIEDTTANVVEDTTPVVEDIKTTNASDTAVEAVSNNPAVDNSVVTVDIGPEIVSEIINDTTNNPIIGAIPDANIDITTTTPDTTVENDLTVKTDKDYFKDNISSASYIGNFNSYDFNTKDQYIKDINKDKVEIPTDSTISMDIDFGLSKNQISNGLIHLSDGGDSLSRELTFDGDIDTKKSTFKLSATDLTKGKGDGTFYGNEANLMQGNVDMKTDDKVQIKGSFDATKQ